MPDRSQHRDGTAEILEQLAELHHIDVSGAHLLHQHSNTAIALPSSGLLVRIAGNPDALEAVTASVAVTRWLAARRYPCVAPADIEPFISAGRVVSLWQLIDVADGPPGNGAELGRLLRQLHDQPKPPFPLATLDDPLRSVARAVDNAAHGLADDDRHWLRHRINQLRQQWTRLTPALPTGLIHGDAHSNNIIRNHSGTALLGDWDHTALGPREWDLIQPHYMKRRFNRHTEQEIADFTTTYGWDVRTWDGFPLLIEIREISGLSPYIRKSNQDEWARDEVTHRLQTLKDADTSTHWHSPPRRQTTA
ncbi:aminoglycoside phosphotransferase family protein [Actinomadura fulvescens]|uniref:Aminoglycoside phosphotransferase family protein n=1 Tax=Actinomadura fulvescens TaxID=46160 RepID=A0ABN3Q2Y4_9ACTN